MEAGQLAKQIIRCCFKVHKELGPVFTEKIYHVALKISLKQEGDLFFKRRK